MEMNLVRIFEILERIEKRQTNQEKRLEEMMEEMKELKIENRRNNWKWMMNFENYDLTINGVECILSFMEPIKRLELSMQCESESMQTIEKSVPMHIEVLQILANEILIDDFKYTIQHQLSSFREGFPVCVSINTTVDCSLDAFENSARNGIFDLFSGRISLRVDQLRIGLFLPFDLNIDAGLVSVIPDYGFDLKNHLNTVRSADSIDFTILDGIEDLRHPIVRNARRIRKVKGDDNYIFEELKNLQAETIIIHFESDTSILVDLILKWCETRNGKVGSELYLKTNRSQHDAVFSSHRLFDAGVVYRLFGGRRLYLPMENNSKAVFSVRYDIGHHLDTFYSLGNDVSEYLYIQVIRR